MTQPPPAQVPVSAPVVATREPTPQQAVSVSDFVTRNLDADELASMLRRADDLIKSGDLSSARLLLRRVAEAGDARAAFTLAGTKRAALKRRAGLVASAEPFSLLLSFLVLSYRTLAVEFSMRWIRRTNRRWSTWLALAAMALQLVLSFGHIHLEKLASGSVIASATTSDAPSSQQNPAQHPANEADNFCAICATIHLASSSFLPDAPLLQVPFASRTIEHFGNFNFIFVSPQRAAFQSRAPPLA